RLACERSELLDLQLGAPRLLNSFLDLRASGPDRAPQLTNLVFETHGFLRPAPGQEAIDLEECIVDSVLLASPLGSAQLIVISPEDRVLQMLDRARKLRKSRDGGRLLLVCRRLPEQTLAQLL